MGIDYVLIASIALYFVAVRMLAATGIKTYQLALFVVIVLTGLSLVLAAILAGDFSFMSPQAFVTPAVQFLFLWWVFRTMRQDDESSVGWLLWGATGWLVAFLAIPPLVSFVL